jgi:hypothetical protein
VAALEGGRGVCAQAGLIHSVLQPMDKALPMVAAKDAGRVAADDGFNEGWIEFQDIGSHAVKGRTDAVAVIAALVANTDGRRSPPASRRSRLPRAPRPRRRLQYTASRTSGPSTNEAVATARERSRPRNRRR